MIFYPGYDNNVDARCFHFIEFQGAHVEACERDNPINPKYRNSKPDFGILFLTLKRLDI